MATAQRQFLVGGASASARNRSIRRRFRRITIDGQVVAERIEPLERPLHRTPFSDDGMETSFSETDSSPGTPLESTRPPSPENIRTPRAMSPNGNLQDDPKANACLLLDIGAQNPEAEPIDPNGNFVLMIVFVNHELQATSFKVSSGVLSLASKPLKSLIEVHVEPGEWSEDISLDSPHLTGVMDTSFITAMIRGGRPDPVEHTVLILTTTGIANSTVLRAIQTVLNILHFRTEDLPKRPTICLMGHVAEVALVFDCLGTISPWIQTWLVQRRGESSSPSLTESQTITKTVPQGTALLKTVYSTQRSWISLSFAMGDKKSFSRASLEYIVTSTLERHGLDFRTSFGIFATLSEDLLSAREEIIEEVNSILNSTYAGFLGSSDSPPSTGQALMLGAYVHCIDRIFGMNNFPLTIQWNDSIIDLFNKVIQVQQVLTDTWAQATKILDYVDLEALSNPDVIFQNKVIKVLDGLKGLELEQYRPLTARLMDLGPYM